MRNIKSIVKQSALLIVLYKIIVFPFNFLYKIILRLKQNIFFRPGVTIDFSSYFERNIFLYDNSTILRSKIGQGTIIGKETKIVQTKIGRYCNISNNIRIIAGNHPIKKFVSMHPAFFSLSEQSGFTFVKKQLFEENSYSSLDNNYYVVIGNDVWIGDGALIINGVTIGDGSVIGAGAIVTHDIEPYSINVGVPARAIGHRFTEEQRKFLLEFKWWDKGESWIKENSVYFQDIDIFLSKNNKL